MRLSFLHAQYTPAAYCWEGAEAARALALCLCTLAVGRASVQAAISPLVLAAYVLAATRVQPVRVGSSRL